MKDCSAAELAHHNKVCVDISQTKPHNPGDLERVFCNTVVKIARSNPTISASSTASIVARDFLLRSANNVASDSMG